MRDVSSIYKALCYLKEKKIPSDYTRKERLLKGRRHLGQVSKDSEILTDMIETHRDVFLCQELWE